MEFIAFVIALIAIFAVKSFAMLRYADDEIAKSTSFSWIKPGMKPEPVVLEAAEAVEPRRSTSWAPSTAAAHLRSNRWAVPMAR